MVHPKSHDKLFFMTQERTPLEKKNFFQRIITPHRSIEDHAERRFSSALATLLLALLPLYFLPEGIRALIEKHPWVNISYFAVGIVILGSAYLLARSPYPRWGAAFTMLYFTLLPFASLVVQAERYSGENAKNALIWSVPIMLMALILLHPKDIKWIVFFQVGLYLVIPALWDGLSYAQVLSIFWIIVAVGGLMILSAFVQDRYLQMAEQEAKQSKISERRFREIFLGSPIALWEADFSKIKERLDALSEEHSIDLMNHVLENPEVMEGAASSVRLLDANLEAIKLYEAENKLELLNSLNLVVGQQGRLDLRDGVIALWEGKNNLPIESTHKTLNGKEKMVIVRFSIRAGYEDTWKYVNISIDDVTERKEAERENFRQGEFLQTIIDGIGSPFYVLNADDYSIALANEKARELGIESRNLCYALTHRRDIPCDGLDHPCPLKHVVANKEPYTVEHVHYRADSSPYYVDVHGYPIYDEEGNVVQMIEYSIDITARKDAENELRKLSSATEQAASGIVITNIEGVIEFANPAAAKITGYSLEELIGETPNLLKSGEHEASFYDELWATIEKGEIWRGELINRRKDGSLYWESQVISPVRDENNEITHYVAIKEDVTKIKEAEEGLRNLSNATEQTANGVVITDLDGHIQYVNPAFSIISGYAQEEVIGKTLEIQRSGEHSPDFYSELNATVARGEIWKGEIINRRKDGSLYWESQVISPVKNDDGEITHHVLVKEDITRRKELEQALALAHEEALVASDMKTQLLANVSHDMRTPLGAILGYTEMLDAGVFTPLNAEQAEATRAIASSSQRLLDFVNNLLSQAQIETGKIILNETPFKPEKILDSLGSEISLARTQGLSVETKIDENLPEIILCDPYWLGQILHNLLSNAIKFTPAGGKIDVQLLRQNEKMWALRVADTGKGIPLEAQEYIFESFRQVDGSLTRETHTGSGLGLSIVNHLVRLMDGEIELESEAGKGSIFTILLPLEYEKEKEA
jgi:PAS domain S-box-containing protein